MRKYVSKLVEEGDITIIEKEVDPKFELARVTQACQKQSDKAILFKNVKGTKMPVVTNLYGSRRRLCELIGAEGNLYAPRWKELMRNSPIKDDFLKEVPTPDDVVECKLNDLPLITYFEKDGGQYFTSAIYLANDPDTGIANLSFNRSLYVSNDEIRCNLGKAHDMTRYQAIAEARGEPLEAALLIGPSPEVFIGAAAALRYDEDELQAAAKIIGGPIPMRRCKNIDVMVPAETEIVVEGRILPNVRRPEGPFGEFMGHYYTRGDRWVFEVLGVYCKKDTIFHSILCGSPEEIQSLQLTMAAKIYSHTSDAVPGILDVSCKATLANTIVQIDKQYEGHARHAGLAAMGAEILMSKYCTVVDKDVDIHDLDEIMWATVLRASPNRDVITVEGIPGFYRDPGKDHWGRLLIDATMEWGREKELERKRIPGQDEIDLGDYID